MNIETPRPNPPARAGGLAWSALGASVALLLPLALWLLRPGGSIGADRWLLKTHLAWPFASMLLPLGALLIFGGLAVSCVYDRFYRAKSPREAQMSMRLAVAALMLLSAVWNWGIVGPAGVNVKGEPRTGFFMVLAASWSDVATEYLGAAYQVEDARRFSSRYASDWQKPRSATISHVATHPPGAVLFYFACRRAVQGIPVLREQLLSIAERATGQERAPLAVELNEMRLSSAISGGNKEASTPLPVDAIATALLASALLAASAALAVPAVFALGSMGAAASEEERRRLQGRGIVAAALWILAPTTGLFAPTLDALVALGAAWTLALACKYLQAPNRRPLIIGVGAILALTAFVSFGASTIGLALALWLLLERRPRDLLWLLAGAAGMQIVLLIVFPHNLPQVFAQAMGAHRQATLSTRSYGTWIALNPLIFALFIGWPVVVGTARGLFLPSTCDDGLAHLKKLALATLGAMLLISLAGSVRGEVERLWMFLLPPFCALAGASWLPLSGGPRRSKVALVGVVALLVVILQAAQSLLMAATLAPLVLP